MKHLLQIAFLLFSSPFFSQTNSKVIKQISTADSVVFIAKSSGCFNAGTTTYKFVKQKNKEHKVIYSVEKLQVVKKISAKNYEAFLKRFEVSAERFKDPDEKKSCTTISDFELKDKKQLVKFTNGTCQPEFNPEEFLLQLLK